MAARRQGTSWRTGRVPIWCRGCNLLETKVGRTEGRFWDIVASNPALSPQLPVLSKSQSAPTENPEAGGFLRPGAEPLPVARARSIRASPSQTAQDRGIGGHRKARARDRDGPR